MQISPFWIANIFQSTSHISSKIACVHEPASGQDIHEVLPCAIETRSDHHRPVIMRCTLKLMHSLPLRSPHSLRLGLIEHPRFVADPQEMEDGGCIAVQRL
jgi:TPP-dependent indolepyruvate ferredoxin oxidoreductase alpha subunit